MSGIAEETLPTVETAKELGLLPEEYEKIIEVMGRKPNFTELSIFSVMWSEHCSYKNSIKWLKKLPREGEHIMVEAGEENAGLVDIGDGYACAFKIESHNHPSAIEPYQGAATGVGGIHRDIFTMGARPIAALNSLRFGKLEENKRNRQLIKGVVKGIGDYGNCFGVPTVAGEVYFDDCYTINPLVNAMSVGYVKADETVSAISQGVGNPVYIVGSSTGKDGIHGATFASGDITEDSAEDLPAVQVGDPFQEKLLLEATLEAIKTGAVVGMQDMGAAGITCSTSEMSEKGGCGMIIHLDKVPTRQENMKPFEILLSESQERMLVVVEKGREKDIEAVFDKWDLNCAIIGEVVEGNTLEYYDGEELVASVPADALVLGGGAPIYDREVKEPEYLKEIAKYDPAKINIPVDLKEVAKGLTKNLNIASKKWVYRQYDSMVGLPNRTTNKASDAAVVRVPGTEKSLVVTVDCNARYVNADPKIGAEIAVSEAARNIVCTGGEPAAITNCLNFGNPYNPEVYWQFTNAIMGMKSACEALGTPVTGGNVSFYNQSSDEGPVFPTPTIGMLGIMNDASRHTGLAFTNSGDSIYLLGASSDDLACSEYIYSHHKVKYSPAPQFDLQEELALQAAVSKAIGAGVLNSAHDVSDGGLFITLLESAMANGLGFDIKTNGDLRKDAFLFGEKQSRVVVSVSADKEDEFLDSVNIPCSKIGTVNNGDLVVDGDNWGNVEVWASNYNNSLGDIMQSS